MYGLSIGESKRLMLKYIDEYSMGGSVIPEADNLDYLQRHNAFADVVQSSLAQLFPTAARMVIEQRALEPLVAAGGIGVRDKAAGESVELLAAEGGAFYCELAGEAVLFLEEQRDGQWRVLQRFEQQSAQSGVYKGNLNGQSASFAKRLRVAGDYACVVRNAVLYRTAFATDADVPDCRAWRRYEMPEDFLRLDQVVVEDGLYYGGEGIYHWQNARTLVLPHDLTARIEVRYWAYPPKIDDLTPDDYHYPLAPEVARLIPLKVAALIIPTERAELSLRLLQLYEQELARLQGQGAVEHQHVHSVYSI